MKFAFKFSNLLGTVYRKGDLIFSPDGNSVISPVGNRITIYDLKNNKATTLPVESRFNYTALDLSPNGCILVAVNEEGEAHMISLVSRTIVHRYRFNKPVLAIKFSPDGKYFAACKENNVFVFKAPGPFTGEYNAFVMERVFHGAFDATTCLAWAGGSTVLAVGSRDMATKLYSMQRLHNFRPFSLGSHTDSIVGCFFEKNSLDITTVARNGQVCVWECSVELSELSPMELLPPAKKIRSRDPHDSEDDILDPIEEVKSEMSKDKEFTLEFLSSDSHDAERDSQGKVISTSVEDDKPKFFYRRVARHYLADAVRQEDREATLTAAAYHQDTRILVTGFSNGSFFLHELPEVNMIHSLSISQQHISSLCINPTGDWIALGCSGLGQLLVWEWQSEQYVMKQQGHSSNMSCLCYSPDSQYIVTGGLDGKVKLWNITSGFCVVTFSEHTSAVMQVVFSTNNKFFVSTSLDGTVRCYDIVRYRNFRTLTSPRPVQFSCLALDSVGELVCAGGQDVFELYLWSVKLGRLLEVLSGHEGPVASVAFSPAPGSSALASASWDKTLRLWNALDSTSTNEAIRLGADALCVVYKPNGEEVAVATLDGQITMFDVKTCDQVHSIEGRNDLGSGRSTTDLVTAKQSLQGKAFSTLCYSADGECILAGGHSKNVCIYNVQEGILLKKFEITQNRSFDAVDDFVNRRQMSEFGNLALVEERETLEGGDVSIKLPGVRSGDMASRSTKPEVRVLSLQFSTTGHSWAACTTEGLLVYSLDTGLVFDPFMLDLGVTPDSIRNTLKEQEYSRALMMSLRLNEIDIIQEVFEQIPAIDVQLTVTSLPTEYALRTLKYIAKTLDGTAHIQFYLCWVMALLNFLGPKGHGTIPMPTLVALEKNITRKYEQLSKICDFNKYTMEWIEQLGALKASEEVEQAMEDMEIKQKPSDDTSASSGSESNDEMSE